MPQREPLPAREFAAALVIGGAGTLVLVGVPYALVLLPKPLDMTAAQFLLFLKPTYSYALLFLLPLCQGVFAGFQVGGYRVGFARYAGLTFCILVLDYFLAAFLFREGVICLVLAMPLYILIIATGIAVGRAFSKNKIQQVLQVSLIPLLVIGVVYDTQSAPPDFSNAISDAVTIKATPEQVWRYIVQYPENTKPADYWLWQAGMPMPVNSVAAGSSVGAARECRFTQGLKFDEEITELVPNRVLTFKITAQPDHPEILGHFSLDKGQLYLEANADGTTTVIATSWYRIFVRPAAYFDWWAADIVRHVHFRVLNHMKELAEADRRAEIAGAAEEWSVAAAAPK